MTSREIETERLSLRPFTESDLDSLHQLWTEPGVRQYLWDDEVIPKERTRSIIETSIESFEANGFGLWAVFLRSDRAMIGFCGFWNFHDPPRLELLYGITASRWRQGFASEVARAMIRYGFEELSLERIEASTDAANLVSTSVMKAVGMSFWKRELTNGLETIYYAISREEFQGVFTQSRKASKDAKLKTG